MVEVVVPEEHPERQLIPPSTYTVPSHAKTYDISPESDPGGAWTGTIDKSDPRTWKAVQMLEPDANGTYKWKVVNKDDKNIVCSF